MSGKAPGGARAYKAAAALRPYHEHITPTTITTTTDTIGDFVAGLSLGAGSSTVSVAADSTP
ncbi:uncharacterized protein CANTADRAFT_250045 [Suhomyces tanzawaensis NRRL Y-17324]|uniref:Uncharacterized protein n=1 Tax=Suhomyces tanzawaensis NRRL Y-17324 TaxID=984487 RepID=A0A1E4SI74_9ASCO|nr:uncharacterized protein CANTADRAFT_250045 [Suhomyces tanzawaensis NRRL Y-17324]ODV79201.1 hypothetical protein CANTADRAFT_250045 [Suhomyces tanzawaensis NRRL Y-17324]